MRCTIISGSVLLFSLVLAEQVRDKNPDSFARRAQVSSGDRNAHAARNKLHRKDLRVDHLASINTAQVTKGEVIPTLAKAAETCDKAHLKSQINRSLGNCNSDIKAHVESINTQCNSVNSANAQDVGSQIATELQGISSILSSHLGYIQECGMDAEPLSSDNGVSYDMVSTTAFQMVMTLEPAFISISELYSKYPPIESTCSESLTNVSMGLSSVIGACGEQINLFDIGFFKLASPQMKAFAKISNHFSGFVGGFNSRK